MIRMYPGTEVFVVCVNVSVHVLRILSQWNIMALRVFYSVGYIYNSIFIISIQSNLFFYIKLIESEWNNLFHWFPDTSAIFSVGEFATALAEMPRTRKRHTKVPVLQKFYIFFLLYYEVIPYKNIGVVILMGADTSYIRDDRYMYCSLLVTLVDLTLMPASCHIR